MTDAILMKNAQNMYNNLCAMLDEKEVRYNRMDDEMMVKFTMRGEDLPMDYLIAVDAERELVRLFSYLPVTFSGDDRVLGAVVTCRINYELADGCFDYNFADGTVMFRMTASYKDSLISKDLLAYMVACTGYTVDKYNDTLLLLAKGRMSLEEFLKGMDE